MFRCGLPALVLLLWYSLGALAGGLTPEEALRRMKVPDGLEARLVACEPLIRQPVSMSFDDRGRLWVIQYLQYPTPAGLKAVSVDQYLRTKYDRVPEPPPRGPKGADRITILSDPDEHGRFRQAKDFISNLNLCSGMAIGHGGVFVMQPPYLLFFPDRDGDDVPDGDPEVLLSGFGTEDAHAVANSLQWGPDGWLYGAQGSTVTANVRGIEFQQGIWRYHPITKVFELFAEGGGNTWGLDFDRHGQAIAGTNWSGFAMLHQVQGAYYIKGFGKHGPLHNPHAYGYFDHVPCPNFKGGHVTCGGIVYRGGAYPNSFRDRYIAGNLLSNALYWYEIDRKGSSYTSRQGGYFLVANDPWFRPVDCLVGPNGAVYVADWYDQRANHVDPVDNWDRTNGRIYKVVPKSASPAPPIHLSKHSSRELVGLLFHANSWFVGEARRLLAERRDATVIPELTRLVRAETGQRALESLWALYVSGGLSDGLAAEFLGHSEEDVRAWTVRLIGDTRKITPVQQERFVALARTDPSPTVRSQLACTCKRLAAGVALPVIVELLARSEDVHDPFIPLLLWWAIEDKAVSDRKAVLGLFDAPDRWRQPLVRTVLLERIGRRYLAEGNEPGYEACTHLLNTAPGRPESVLLVRGMEQALIGRRLEHVPRAFEKPLNELERDLPEPLWLRFAVRLGSTTAYDRLVRRVRERTLPQAEHLSLIATLGEIGRADAVPILLAVLRDAPNDGVRSAVLTALQAFADPRIADAVLVLYPQFSPSVRGKTQGLLASRPASAVALLQAVDAGHIQPKEVALDQLQRLSAYKQDSIDRLIAKHWGTIAPETSGEKQAHIRHLSGRVLNAGKGDPARGKTLFTQHCATCHTLFGEGGKIGPELTGADRKNRDWLLSNIIDPSGVIRPEFIAYDAALKDGRSLFGMIVEQSPQTVTLVDAKNEKTVLERSKIESLEASKVSLMPEKLLDELTNEQLRDLFAYLQADNPPAVPAMPAVVLTFRTQKPQRDAQDHLSWAAVTDQRPFVPTRTAVIVCDMWDNHWSRGAAERVTAMAPEMNNVLKAVRTAGVTIIHAPSETMAFYADHAARKRAKAVQRINLPPLADHDDPPMPVDASDGGSDTGEKPWYRAWTRQHSALEIDGDRDYVTDDAQEIWNILRQKDIDQILLMGVHTNMCCLNRSWAIKALVRRGQKAALVRDLTDAMYNPARPPYVSHAEGTHLVIEYIEKYRRISLYWRPLPDILRIAPSEDIGNGHGILVCPVFIGKTGQR
jgi:putative membrane-bound dehydrogenase-like protein